MLDPIISAYDERVITGAQSRAARALIGLEQRDLAKRIGVSTKTILRFENAQSTPHRFVMREIERVFSELGVLFIDENEVSPRGGAGVRLRDVIPVGRGGHNDE